MFKILTTFVFLLFLNACMPGSNNDENNQFSLKNKQLFYLNHQLVHWSERNLPQCKHCSFNIYTKKMLPKSMLFKQVNNERGDLAFLAASNIRYSFALQTGGSTYSISVNLEGDMISLFVEAQQPFILKVNDKQKIRLGLANYFIKLQHINVKEQSVDLIIYPENLLK